MEILKQSTAVTVKMGPFLDDTDGKTAETGLTISQADIRLSKNGGNIAQTNNSAGATHDELGYYDIPLDTTDTGTLGRLRVAIHESGALPVWADFLIVPANVYDSLVLGTDYLQSDAVQVEGSDATDQINAACDTALSDYDAVVPADLPTNFADLSITETTGRVDVAAIAGTAQTANDNGADINAILVDTGTTLPGLLAVIDGIVDSILEDTGTTIPGTISTMQGNVTDILADTAEIQGDTHTAAEVWDATSTTLSLSFETMLDRIYQFLMNKMNITDATGSVALRNVADNANIATQTVTDDDTTTTRTALSWS